jgi:signal transduction histidine kinase
VIETTPTTPDVHRATSRRGTVLAWAMLGTTIAFAAAGSGLDVANGQANESFAYVAPIGFAVVGFLLATRRSGNPLGWLMLVAGLTFAFPGDVYATYATVTRHGELPGAALALTIATPMWVPFIGISGMLLLLFPDGHLPSPRWRLIAWIGVVGMCAVFFLSLVLPATGADGGLPQLENPLAIPALRPLDALQLLALLVPAIVAGGAIALILRLRRSIDPIERQQLRWVAWAAGVLAFIYALAFLIESLGILPGSPQWNNWVGAVVILSFVLIPIAIGIAVLKYRLYDIDLVIRKTVVFAVVAGFIAAVYASLVIGVGALVGSGGSPVLSATAAAIVALVFQPVRARARRVADRVVYGKRATPYEVLADLGGRLSETYDAAEVLPRLARVLGEGVGARRARVWLRVDGRMNPAATWPADGDEDLPDEFITEVRHQGEYLGALSLSMPANDPMDPSKRQLVADLASQVGLVLRNVRLTEDLKARLVDLTAAQMRLVKAQDEERRKLERNIHDGAQQQLVAMAVKVKLADALVDRDPAKAHSMLDELRAETTEALEDLRQLARGIYPPLLADQGLAAALTAHARRAPLPVRVSADGVVRYPPEAEAAVYFSCLEALQNVAKYAEATGADVRLSRSDGRLSFEVVDDGRGFDPAATALGTGLQGMSDRLGALGGFLEVRSAPGTGTTVAGWIPAEDTA